MTEQFGPVFCRQLWMYSCKAEDARWQSRGEIYCTDFTVELFEIFLVPLKCSCLIFYYYWLLKYFAYMAQMKKLRQKFICWVYWKINITCWNSCWLISYLLGYSVFNFLLVQDFNLELSFCAGDFFFSSVFCIMHSLWFCYFFFICSSLL